MVILLFQAERIIESLEIYEDEVTQRENFPNVRPIIFSMYTKQRTIRL